MVWRPLDALIERAGVRRDELVQPTEQGVRERCRRLARLEEVRERCAHEPSELAAAHVVLEQRHGVIAEDRGFSVRQVLEPRDDKVAQRPGHIRRE